jgi:hypothetical protein
MAWAKRRRSGSDSDAFSSEASRVAAEMDSRLAAATSRVPYFAAMISPCSVMRMRPRTVPCGWARMAAKDEPPPRPTAPPRPWKICIGVAERSNTECRERVAWCSSQTEVRYPPSLLESE